MHTFGSRVPFKIRTVSIIDRTKARLLVEVDPVHAKGRVWPLMEVEQAPTQTHPLPYAGMVCILRNGTNRHTHTHT